MAYDPEIERRLDAAFLIFPNPIRRKLAKKKMFGGLAYLYSGKMTVGIVGDDLMVRIVAAKMPEFLKQKEVRPMDFTNRPMKEFIFVSPDGFANEARLQDWIGLGLEHAQTVLKEL